MDQFVNSLMKEAKLDTLPEEFQISLRDQLTTQAYRRIGAAILKELNEKDSDAFLALVDLTKPEDVDQPKLNAFLSEKITDFEAKVSTALESLAGEFLTNMQEA